MHDAKTTAATPARNAFLEDAVRKAITDLQSALDHQTAEFPKMMYHADEQPRTVASADEQKKLEAEGWTTVHDPATGQEPRAAQSKR